MPIPQNVFTTPGKFFELFASRQEKVDQEMQNPPTDPVWGFLSVLGNEMKNTAYGGSPISAARFMPMLTLGPRQPKVVQGTKGDKGDPGRPGPRGAQGLQGHPGSNGEDGHDGRDGEIRYVREGHAPAEATTGPEHIPGTPTREGPVGVPLEFVRYLLDRDTGWHFKDNLMVLATMYRDNPELAKSALDSLGELYKSCIKTPGRKTTEKNVTERYANAVVDALGRYNDNPDEAISYLAREFKALGVNDVDKLVNKYVAQFERVMGVKNGE